MESESKYLNHRVIPNIIATGVVLAEDVADVLGELNSVNTVKVVLLDSICSDAVLVTAPEKSLKRKLHTIKMNFHLEVF